MNSMDVGQLRLYLLAKHIARFYEEMDRAFSEMYAKIMGA